MLLLLLSAPDIFSEEPEFPAIEEDSTDNSTSDYDGPYVIYRNGSTIIKQVIKGTNDFACRSDSISGFIEGKLITCNINDSLSFVTIIKDTLVVENPVYEMPEKLIAISDIEGNFGAFREFLINNKVINSNNQWIYGRGHLVLNGDFFDRGLNVTECLWFVYHLEQEAVKNGGYVHFILGNHEIMNMNDDIRYVRNKYLKNAELMDEDYRSFYKQNTELGRWLETKNIIEKIGDYLFLHGGISEELNMLNPVIEDINTKSRNYYYSSKAARQSGDTLVSTVFRSKYSPFWYRGYVEETIKEESLDLTLKIFNVNKIVVGHTIVDDVRYFYSKKVIGIDTDHAEGDTEGLLIENGSEFRVDKTGIKTLIR
ncbi:MAG TPA: metallophosphoesterase [Ignavibacteria bacterium]|nr:metallophosphoesterase [Ignavibacteria bacterium]HMQ97469.1 metallophosphoesterase [Ignavibacteria bacterium]